jgi:hypothetical protein
MTANLRLGLRFLSRSCVADALQPKSTDEFTDARIAGDDDSKQGLLSSFDC